MRTETMKTTYMKDWTVNGKAGGIISLNKYNEYYNLEKKIHILLKKQPNRNLVGIFKDMWRQTKSLLIIADGCDSHKQCGQ